MVAGYILCALCQAFRNKGVGFFFLVVPPAALAQTNAYLYWRTHADTDARSCAGCVIEQGTLRGRVGAPVQIKPGTTLISVNSDETSEMDGRFWVRVFRPYNVDKPILGYSLRPEDTLIALKDQLDFGLSVQPNQPESHTAPPSWPFMGRTSDLVAGGFILGGLLLFWFVVRSRQLAPAPAPSNNSHGGGFFAGVHPLALIIGGVVVVYGALCVIPATISLMLYYLVHRGQGFTSAGAQSLVTMLLFIFGSTLFLLALVLVFSRLKRVAFALLLLSVLIFAVRSVLTDGRQDLKLFNLFSNRPAAASGASPESATAQASGQQPSVKLAASAPAARRIKGGWQIRALANQANPLSLELPAGRYEVTVTSPDGILWDPNAPRVFVDAKTVEAKYRFRPEEFPLGELGVCKPVLLTSAGKIGLGRATQRLDLNQPTKIEGVVQNNRPSVVKASRGHWIIRIVKEDGSAR